MLSGPLLSWAAHRRSIHLRPATAQVLAVPVTMVAREVGPVARLALHNERSVEYVMDVCDSFR